MSLKILFLYTKKQKGRCALSGMLMTYAKDGTGKKEFNISIDRIHPHRGYIASNMQLVCHRVNINETHTHRGGLLVVVQEHSGT